MSANRYIRFVELSSGLIRDDLNAYSLIPVRTRKRKRIFGVYRRELARSFDQIRYHQRNKIETVFSILKRKFGEALKARKFQEQIKELKIKLILYNLSKIILAVFIRICYGGILQSPFFILSYCYSIGVYDSEWLLFLQE